jgi:signal-transduction protein with cAMP-binding, CBS, and nucleotidyltransferase domain
MRAEALVRRSPVTISSRTSIKQAAEVFAREKIGLLVVAQTPTPAQAQAVVSERDIVRAVAAGASLANAVDTISTKSLVTVRRSDPISKAVRLMLENNIRHLVVENYDGTLFGVLSIRDILREKRLLESLVREEANEVLGGD